MRTRTISAIFLSCGAMVTLSLFLSLPACQAAGEPGTLKWTFTTGGEVLSSPAIGADGTVYIGSNDNNVYALDGQTGAKKWVFATRGEVRSSPAIGADGSVYVGGGWATYCLDGQTGQKKWMFEEDGAAHASPAIGADGTVYVGAMDKNGFNWYGIVYALDGKTGTKKWSFRTKGSVSTSPAIGTDGTVYVGIWGGSIHALMGNSGSALRPGGPWPMFHQNARHTGRAD